MNFLFPVAVFSITPYKQVLFLDCTKKPMSVLSLKQSICLWHLTTDQYPCLTSKVKFSKDLFPDTCLIIFKIIIIFRLYKLAFYHETPALTNLHFFIILSVRRLILARWSELSSVTSAKPLAIYDILVFCINFWKLVLQEIS